MDDLGVCKRCGSPLNEGEHADGFCRDCFRLVTWPPLRGHGMRYFAPYRGMAAPYPGGGFNEIIPGGGTRTVRAGLVSG